MREVSLFAESFDSKLEEMDKSTLNFLSLFPLFFPFATDFSWNSLIILFVQERRRFYAGLVVAAVGRFVGCKHSDLSFHSKARRFGMDRSGYDSLGPSNRLVQQHRLELRANDREAIRIGIGTIRME